MPLDAGFTQGDSLFRALLESAPDAIVIVNSAGEIVLINTQTERLFGYTRDELLGEAVEILVPRRFHRHASHRDGYFRAPRVREMGAGIDLVARRKNGDEFPVEISLSPLDTKSGLLVSSSIRDVTDRKRVERALQEKNVELERASFAKDRFLASMSHELRTPLNAIIGFTGTLLMRLPGPLTADQAHQLEIVQSSARHLLSLINDILDLARIQSGKLEINRERISCRAVTVEVATTLRPLAEAKSLEFDVVVPGGEVEAWTDRRALSQILLNLATNAIKFTDRGRVRLEIREPRSDHDAIEFAISDTGAGIAAEDQERLFDAFTQLATAAGRGDGTGLGLYLSRQLAGILGGSIGLTSRPGEGSTFTLSLPRA